MPKISVLAMGICYRVQTDRWYHGVLSRVEAENILKDHHEGSYLLRANLDYSLSIK